MAKSGHYHCHRRSPILLRTSLLRKIQQQRATKMLWKKPDSFVDFSAKEERTRNNKDGVLLAGHVNKFDGEVRFLLCLWKKPNSSDGLTAKKETAMSNKGGVLLARDFDELDGNIRILLKSSEKPDSLVDISAKEETKKK
eukprot:15010583-Ditylum_brightwellii.AAC.1